MRKAKTYRMKRCKSKKVEQFQPILQFPSLLDQSTNMRVQNEEEMRKNKQKLEDKQSEKGIF